MKIKVVLATVAVAACWALPGIVKAGGPPAGAAVPSPSAALAAPGSPFLTIPAETEASVVLLSGIHTKISEVNDRVEGQIVQPVYVDGELALPTGTLLFGRITNVRPAGRLHRPAQIGFRFEKLSLPDGETESITARLAALENPGKLRLDREGYLTGGHQISWHFLTGTLVGASALTIIPKVAGVTAGATAASIATAGFLGYWVLFPRGPEVQLTPDTRCRVRFDYSFTVHGQS
ncbi:MAG TPA: hypothetical protein VI455_09745 [Terriglobia bacterium]